MTVLTIEQLKPDNSVRIWCRHIMPCRATPRHAMQFITINLCEMFLWVSRSYFSIWCIERSQSYVEIQACIFHRLLLEQMHEGRAQLHSVVIFIPMKCGGCCCCWCYGNTIPNNWIWKWIWLHQTRDFVAATISGFLFFHVCVWHLRILPLNDILSFNLDQCNWQ